MHTMLCDRLFRTAERAKHVSRDDALTAESAKDDLVFKTYRLGRFTNTVCYVTCPKVGQMLLKYLPHFARRAEPSLGIVFHRTHQDPFHLVRQSRIDLTWTWVLLKIEDQQRIALRVGTRQKMKHR